MPCQPLELLPGKEPGVEKKMGWENQRWTSPGVEPTPLNLIIFHLSFDHTASLFEYMSLIDNQ